MINLTPTHRRTVERWLETYHKHNEQFEIPIQFTRVLSGDKPATVIQTIDWDFPDSPFDSEGQLIAFIEEVGLSTHQMRKERNQYVGRSEWLDVLPSTSGMVTDEWHRRLGYAFGYPEDAIEWFIKDEDRIEPRDRVNNGDFDPEEMAFIDFVAYKNEDSIAGFERAIEEGKRIRGLITEVANKWNLPVLDQLAEDHYQLSLSIYSGEREYFPGEYIGFKMITRNPALDD